MMAEASVPLPVCPGTTQETFKDYIIVHFQFARGIFGSANAKFFGEKPTLDVIAPILNKMFPKSELAYVPVDHMLQCELDKNGMEYSQIQIFKMISAKGFCLKGSHGFGLAPLNGAVITREVKMKTVTYTFALDTPLPACLGTTLQDNWPYDKDFIITHFQFGHGGLIPNSANARFFAEKQTLDVIAPILNKMFPKGELAYVAADRMLHIELDSSGMEYAQIQIFKMISAVGFVLRASHAFGLAWIGLPAYMGAKMKTVTYTFAKPS